MILMMKGRLKSKIYNAGLEMFINSTENIYRVLQYCNVFHIIAS